MIQTYYVVVNAQGQYRNTMNDSWFTNIQHGAWFKSDVAARIVARGLSARVLKVTMTTEEL